MTTEAPFQTPAKGTGQTGLPPALLAVAAIAVAGLALRLAAASGDLWLDEVWSLELVGRLTSVDQVFWRINHDNNHFLNSAYLYLTGPQAAPLAHRALAVAFGVASVVAAAAVTADRGRATQIVASLLFAVSYPMVHYGSEARGYSGLVLFTLLVVLCLERLLDRRGSTIALAAVILLGFLSHVTMAATVAVLVAWTAWVMLRRGDGAIRTARATCWIFLPALLALLPLAACIFYGARTFGFTIGGSTPFSYEAFSSGYGGMIRHLAGLPAWLPDWPLIVTAALCVCLTAWKWPDRRASLYVIGIVGLPALMMQTRLPNLEFPRYFLISGVLLLLWAAELLGRGIEAAGWRRIAALVGLAAMLGGSGSALWRFYETGRGSYSAMVAEMTRDGPARYASSNEFRTPKLVNFHAARLGRQAQLVPADDWCRQRPDWLIVETETDPPPATEHAAGCDLAYRLVDAAGAWGLSGTAWALYQKTN